jgi:hypothetical protein
MEKINKLLENYDALPDMDNWEFTHEKFREKYREAQVIIEEINKTQQPIEAKNKAIEKIDDELIKIFNQLNNVEIIDEPENTVETNGHLSQPEPENIVQTDDNLSQPENPEQQANQILDNYEKNSEEMKKQDKVSEKQEETPKTEPQNTVDTDGHLSLPESENIEKTDGNPSQQEPEKENNEVKTDGNPYQPEPEIINQEQLVNPYQQFEQWASTQEVVKASDLIRFNIPAELWKENKLKFNIGNVNLEKTISSALFNSFVVVK